jgi:CDGSH-type Zn-finger protein
VLEKAEKGAVRLTVRAPIVDFDLYAAISFSREARCRCQESEEKDFCNAKK